MCIIAINVNDLLILVDDGGNNCIVGVYVYLRTGYAPPPEETPESLEVLSSLNSIGKVLRGIRSCIRGNRCAPLKVFCEV